MKKLHVPDDFNGIVLKNRMGDLTDYNVFLRNGMVNGDGQPLYEYHSVHGYLNGGKMKMLDRVTIFDRYKKIDSTRIRESISEGRLVPLSEGELSEVSRIFFGGKRLMTREDYIRKYGVGELKGLYSSSGDAEQA
jgi:hypothetical protein